MCPHSRGYLSHAIQISPRLYRLYTSDFKLAKRLDRQPRVLFHNKPLSLFPVGGNGGMDVTADQLAD